MKRQKLKNLVAGLVLTATCATVIPLQAGSGPTMERGKYLVGIAGCNDCHTPGYMAMDGKVPQESWLIGDSMGWRGPWGTTYAPNLRLFMQGLNEEEWVAYARDMRARPPMPWFNLNQFEESDLRSIYRFVRSLQPAGQPAPAYLPPEQEPPKPYFVLVADPPN